MKCCEVSNGERTLQVISGEFFWQLTPLHGRVELNENESTRRCITQSE